MRETGGLWAAAPDTGGSMEEEALRLLDESQGYLRAILLGVALQYHSLDIERCRLLAEGQNQPGPSPEEVQAAASLITLWALLGFQRQAEGIAAQAALAGGPTDMADVQLGSVSILVTLIRLVRLLAGPATGLEGFGELNQPPGL